MRILNTYRFNINFLIYSHILMAFSSGWSIISVIFYKHIGLDYLDISIAISLTPLFTLLFEIPTGIFSDKYGRKYSIIISFLFCFIAGLILINAHSLFDLIFVSIFYGASYGFWSGAAEALLYESVSRHNRKKAFLKNWSKIILIFTFFGGISQFIIPNLYAINPLIPFYILIIIGFILFIFSFFLKDSHNKKHLDIHWFEYSLIFGFSTIIQSIIITKNSKIVEFISKNNPFVILIFSWSLLVSILYFIHSFYTFIIVLSLIFVISSVFELLINSEINEIVETKYRSTIFSIFSLGQSLFFSILSIISGYTLGFLSLNSFLLIISLIFLIIGLSILKIIKARHFL